MPPLYSRILLIVYAAAAAALSSAYFLHYPIPGFFARLWELGLAVGLLAMAASTGRALLRWTGLDGATGLDGEGRAPESFLWSAALGIGSLSFGLLAVGLAGFFSPQGIALWTGLWALAGLREWRPWLAAFSRANGFSLKVSGWLLPAALGVLLIGAVAAYAPPTYYDSLVYHLALPMKYLQEGRVGFVPYNQYSHFPQNMEMIFGWFLAAGSDVSAHLFNLLLAVLTGLAIFLMGRRRETRWEIFLFLAAPCVILLSSETYVEMPLAFFTTLAVWGAARGLSERRSAWFLLSGLAGGFAAGIKYTAILTPMIATVLAILWVGDRSWRERLRDGALLGASALAIFFPWMAKNYAMTGGNPFFPFLPSIFPAKNVYMYAESSKAYFQVLSEYSGKSSLLIDLFIMPFRLATNATSFGGGFDVTGDMGWALPLILLPLALALLKKGRGFLLAYAAAHIFLWASMRPVLRFLFPVFPLVCLLAGEGLGDFFSRVPAWARRSVLAIAGLFVLSNGVLFYLVEEVRDPAPVALGLASRADYLSRKLDYYPAMRFMAEKLPEDAYVLFVGDQRAYYCPRRHLAPMALLPQPLRAWAEESKDGPALARRLRELGFTHVFFNRREADRLESYRVLDFTEHGAKVFYEFIGSLAALYETANHAVYALPS